MKTRLVNPVDSYRVRLRNGPEGGNPEDVLVRKLDAYVANGYWNMDAVAMPYLKLASERNLGTPDFAKLRAQAVSLSGSCSRPRERERAGTTELQSIPSLRCSQLHHLTM